MFETLDVSEWPVAGDEPMGTKRKVWLSRTTPAGVGGQKWLFKYRSRDYTGDDWSEKLAAEVAEALGVPHATVELARRGSDRGVISRDLAGDAQLIPGDRVLAEHESSFPDSATAYAKSDHTLDGVFRVLLHLKVGVADGTPPTAAVRTAADTFCGYLMLDALLGNTDRNPGNWAVLQRQRPGQPRALELCPSYDHASSLGYRETDAKRVARLDTLDAGYGIPAYSLRAKSALYRSGGSALGTHEAFGWAAREFPEAAGFWLSRLRGTSYSVLADLASRVPREIMSGPARRFACELLRSNRETLLAVPTP